jgi:dTDP-4-amino-4,6-dideoxy-D-galactose acyltransferase
MRDGLYRARQRGVRLVYWDADPARGAPRGLLEEYGGSLVDRRLCFGRPLARVEAESGEQAALAIHAHPRTEPARELVRLAVGAGEFSRFRRDPRIPAESFRSLYEIWLEKSIQGDLADLVLVAAAGNWRTEPLGLVTVSLKDGEGSIGLIAVVEWARGSAIGRRLLEAAHGWLAGRRARRVTVVTQLDNHPACRLYERCGYVRAQLRHVYHFWP